MALDLDQAEAIDYSSETGLLPFECTGEYDLAMVGYVEYVSKSELELRRRELKLELGREPKEAELPAVGFKGSCEIASVQVLKSSNELYPAGSVFGLWFDGDATGESAARVAGRNRQFIAACVGESPKAGFKANAARKALLTTDLSSGVVHIHLSRRNQAGKGKYEGQTFANDTYSSIE